MSNLLLENTKKKYTKYTARAEQFRKQYQAALYQKINTLCLVNKIDIDWTVQPSGYMYKEGTFEHISELSNQLKIHNLDTKIFAFADINGIYFTPRDKLKWREIATQMSLDITK